MAPNEPQESARQIIGRILWMSRQHRQRVAQRLEKIDLGGGEAPILMQLSFHGEMNQRELAEHIGVTPATVSQSLKAMVKKGLVERFEDETDARVFRLKLTGLGMEKRREAEQVFAQVDQEILSTLDISEQDQLAGLLLKLETYMRGEDT